MFDAAAATLEVQLVFYRGINECQRTAWLANARVLAGKMSQVMCKAGETQLGRILKHVRREHKQKPVNVAVFVGDAMEEEPSTLYDQAAGLGVPLFMFQEGGDANVEEVFRELVRLTTGAYRRFDAELCRSAARSPVRGRAICHWRSDGSRGQQERCSRRIASAA